MSSFLSAFIEVKSESELSSPSVKKLASCGLFCLFSQWRMRIWPCGVKGQQIRVIYKYSYGLHIALNPSKPPQHWAERAVARQSGSMQGYEQVQSADACGRQSPRQDSQKKGEPAVIDEDGGGVEGSSQRGQQSGEGAGAGQDMASVLKRHDKRHSGTLTRNKLCTLSHALFWGSWGIWKYRRWGMTAGRGCTPEFQSCPIWKK